MQVKDVMTRRALRIGPEEPTSAAARMLARYNIGALPVCSRSGKLLGVITDRDIVLRCVANDRNPAFVPVRNIMSTRLVTVDASVSLEEAAAKMAKEQVRRLPVEDHGRLCGVLSISDLIRDDSLRPQMQTVLSKICSGLSSR